jgi:aminoglycoside 2'-N-acetyltransferase I
MSAIRVRVAQTDELEPERLEELTKLCEAAFDEPFAPVWERTGPGLHVMAEARGRVMAHAMIVDRAVYVGSPEAAEAIDAAYVENVATLPEAQERGYGAAVMRETNRIVAEEYALGVLATGEHGFYARLGWQTWDGPVSVRMADGEQVRAADQDGRIMVLRTPRTPAELRNDAPIAVDWRPGAAW